MTIHFSTITADSEFKSSRYKMMIRFARALANIIQVALVTSNWATKKKYFVWSSRVYHMTLMIVTAGSITIIADVNEVTIMR